MMKAGVQGAEIESKHPWALQDARRSSGLHAGQHSEITGRRLGTVARLIAIVLGPVLERRRRPRPVLLAAAPLGGRAPPALAVALRAPAARPSPVITVLIPVIAVPLTVAVALTVTVPLTITVTFAVAIVPSVSFAPAAGTPGTVAVAAGRGRAGTVEAPDRGRGVLGPL